MAELSQVRAEIKTWERAFRATEGREPSVDDIKKVPIIAQKYKLYKKLSKAATTEHANPAPAVPNSSESFQPPSTPTKRSTTRDAKSSVLFLKARGIEPTAPLSTFNPFSPQKAKMKQHESVHQTDNKLCSNLFASPAKANASLPDPRSPTPTTSLPTNALQPNFPSEYHLISPPPPNAVSRARKRLRGDPVSPSPSKEKRRRTTTSPTTIPFLHLSFNDSEGEEVDEEQSGAEASFIDNSPVKMPSTGRSFTLLFDESVTPAMNLFGLNIVPSSSDSNDFRSAGKQATKGFNTDVKRVRNIKTRVQKHGDGNIFSVPVLKLGINDSDQSRSFDINLSTRGTTPGSPINKEQTQLPNEGLVLEYNRGSKSPLLPPSPPPISSKLDNAKALAKGKRKGDPSTLKGRKKMRLSGNDESEQGSASDEPPLEVKVKVINRPPLINPRLDEEDVGPEFDPLLIHTGMHRSYDRALISDKLQNKVESAEVELPDKFRHVLTLESTDSASRERKEENLVKGLLYGRRISHYDPNKGGEIWDVGEDEILDGGSEVDDKREAEDEWEGEPVPWEVGEL